MFPKDLFSDYLVIGEIIKSHYTNWTITWMILNSIKCISNGKYFVTIVGCGDTLNPDLTNITGFDAYFKSDLTYKEPRCYHFRAFTNYHFLFVLL